MTESLSKANSVSKTLQRSLLRSLSSGYVRLSAARDVGKHRHSVPRACLRKWEFPCRDTQQSLLCKDWQEG
ncbi:MAG: hypothetical protein ACLS48_10030 [[Eubacterium] siraeum]